MAIVYEIEYYWTLDSLITASLTDFILAAFKNLIKFKQKCLLSSRFQWDNYNLPFSLHK